MEPITADAFWDEYAHRQVEIANGWADRLLGMFAEDNVRGALTVLNELPRTDLVCIAAVMAQRIVEP